VPTLVGIDHAFSFPLQYFETYGELQRDWDAFLDDFQEHWPTDEDHLYVDFVRDGTHGRGAARSGDSRWRRLTEVRAGAKSVFQFDVQGQVAKSTHAGLPWLRHIRRQQGIRVHFWPFDGWLVPSGVSAVVEVYPALWKRGGAREGRTADQEDAFVVADWMRNADAGGSLAQYFNPPLSASERSKAGVELADPGRHGCAASADEGGRS
jgi:hypothetical protein